MHATPKSADAATVAIDLAKDVFELAFADAAYRVIERKRLTRKAFARVLANHAPLHLVMEACGSAHFWARHFERLGHRVTLLPAHQVRPYVLRWKTDRTDADGLLEAMRCLQIRPVPIKTPEQQGVQGLHRIREHHKAQRTAAINAVRGLLREFGVVIPAGAARTSRHPHHRIKPVPALLDSISCKRVGPRSSQADNNVGPRDRLNVWPCFADSMMARALAPNKAEYTNATAPSW
jgi:transposase